MAIIEGFKPSKSIHTPKGEKSSKILGKTSICEVLKRKSDSFAKFAKESDERRESNLSVARMHVSVAKEVYECRKRNLSVANE
jgi:hypothetical protein